ncbi:hypothetical protein AM391_RS22590 [Kluyvera ascorbata]|nr:hypothetical protein [Kluyvera ascorbata]
MNTQNVNVKTAAQESSRKMGEGRISRIVGRLKLWISAGYREAIFTEACAEEAHAHYGLKFGISERFRALLSGFFLGLKTSFITFVQEKK